MRPPDTKRRHVWTAPMILAAATLISLIGALLADGIWDRLAALLLLTVLVYAVALGLRPGERGNRR